jgi:predicted ATP-binding protein involved in virulence
MRVTRLKIANLRAIEAAEFKFQPGFNLIVGVNGVGKTSVLDALSISLAPVVKHVNRLRATRDFSADDIRVGADALTVECGIEIDGEEFTYLVHKPRESSASRKKAAGIPRQQVHDTPERSEFIGSPPRLATDSQVGGRPFAILFSTRRAVAIDRAPSKGSSAGGVQAALAEALIDRQLRLSEFAEWMHAQKTLRREIPAADRVLNAFEDAVTRFLPGYSNLRVQRGKPPTLLIDHGRTTLEVWQLSDGERGSLALVLDLTRRLAQANHKMVAPAAKAEAVVLIDELDLHLHPKWQRQIVQNLTTAFPNCQFIATTHSPQVIGEVEHDRIQIIANGQVYSPTHSFGVDSSRVLEEIMDANPRAEEVKTLLSQLSREVGRQQFEQARALLARLVERLGEDDPEVTRIRTLLDFMEGAE